MGILQGKSISAVFTSIDEFLGVASRCFLINVRRFIPVSLNNMIYSIIEETYRKTFSPTLRIRCSILTEHRETKSFLKLPDVSPLMSSSISLSYTEKNLENQSMRFEKTKKNCS